MDTTHSFPDISDTKPLGEEDLVCLAEVREVLTRHGKLNRLGISLLHSHFPVAADELLMESCDPATRTLTIRPVQKSQISADQMVETNWCLTDGEVLLGCLQACGRDPRTGAHVTVHTSVG